MNIALLNVRITFQKTETVADEIGNRMNVWKDYYSCAATVSGEGGYENKAAGLTVSESAPAFTVRLCARLCPVDTTHYRIRFHGDTYNITAIDHMNFKGKCLKFHTERERA